MNQKAYQFGMSIGESLGDFEKRTGMSAADAYAAWHDHGKKIAEAWSVPFARPEILDHKQHEPVVIRGGKVLGLYHL